MKTSLRLLAGLLALASASSAQNGLEAIIVERYYIAEPNDTLANATGGNLALGSVTYRVYADMRPNYKFQAAYGIPGHELRLATTTRFFNNEDRGAVNPTYTKPQTRLNTVMLDSWLSVGAGCNGFFAVQKSSDNGQSTTVNNNTPPLLQGNNPLAGIPLSQEDGLLQVAAAPQQVTMVGIGTEAAIFGNSNITTDTGQVFTTFNGSWAALNGATGPDSASNVVCIGQFTTNGTFSFELNLQLGVPGGGVENYVASNPVGNEILFANCIYNSGVLTPIIDKPVGKQWIHVYPNPAKDLLTVELSQATSSNVSSSIQIISVDGSVVMETPFATSSNSVFRMPIEGLARGLYFVRVQCEGYQQIRKFLKE